MKNSWLVCIAANPLLLLTFCLSSHLPPRRCKRLSHGAQLLGVRAGSIRHELLYHGCDSSDCSWKKTFSLPCASWLVAEGFLSKDAALLTTPVQQSWSQEMQNALFSYCERADPPVVTVLVTARDRRKALDCQRLQRSSSPRRNAGPKPASPAPKLSLPHSHGGLSIGAFRGAVKAEHSNFRMNI